MSRAWAVALAVALAGCIDAAAPEPSTDAAPDPVADPWTLAGVGCTNHLFTVAADRAAVTERTPDHLALGGSTPVLDLDLFLHRCEALVEAETALREEVHLLLLVAPVRAPEHDQPRYLLEAMTDWPALAATLTAAGVPATHAAFSLPAPEAGTQSLRVAGDGVSYQYQGAAPAVPNPSSPLALALFAGADGEFLFGYDVLFESSSDVPAPGRLVATGGVLGAVVPEGEGAVVVHHQVGDFLLQDRTERFNV